MGFQYSITNNNWIPPTGRIHLVATADHLPDTRGEKVSKACSRVWPSLEIPVSKPPVVESMISTISLRGTSDQVLEEISMSRSINDSAATFNGLKLPRSMPIPNVYQSVIFRIQGGQIWQISQLLGCLSSYIISFWHECLESQFWGASDGPETRGIFSLWPLEGVKKLRGTSCWGNGNRDAVLDTTNLFVSERLGTTGSQGGRMTYQTWRFWRFQSQTGSGPRKLIYFGFSHRSCSRVSLIQRPSWAVGKLKLRKLCLLKSCSVGGISA